MCKYKHMPGLSLLFIVFWSIFLIPIIHCSAVNRRVKLIYLSAKLNSFPCQKTLTTKRSRRPTSIRLTSCIRHTATFRSSSYHCLKHGDIYVKLQIYGLPKLCINCSYQSAAVRTVPLHLYNAVGTLSIQSSRIHLRFASVW